MKKKNDARTKRKAKQKRNKNEPNERMSERSIQNGAETKAFELNSNVKATKTL